MVELEGELSPIGAKSILHFTYSPSWSAATLSQETMTRELGRVLRRAPGERSLLEKELVTAVNRVNYNQPNTLNALAGRAP